MSNPDPELVVFPGEPMVDLVQAVSALASAGVGRYAVVGGVAVAARVGRAHRATADVDTVVDDTTPPDALEALASLPGAIQDRQTPHRVWIGGTKIDVMGVGPLPPDALVDLPDRQALFVAAHSWALDTATPLTLLAGADQSIRATALFATPAGLVAMKLHAIQDRSAGAGLHKRAGDAWDLYQLLIERDQDSEIREGFAGATPPLRRLVAQAAERILITGAAKTRGWLQAGDDAMSAVSIEELRYAATPLVNALAE